VKKEVFVRVGRRRGRIDRVTKKKAIEVERSGNPRKLGWACRKLKAIRKRHKILKVPYWDVKKARKIASKVSPSIKVRNLSGK